MVFARCWFALFPPFLPKARQRGRMWWSGGSLAVMVGRIAAKDQELDLPMLPCVPFKPNLIGKFILTRKGTAFANLGTSRVPCLTLSSALTPERLGFPQHKRKGVEEQFGKPIAQVITTFLAPPLGWGKGSSVCPAGVKGSKVLFWLQRHDKSCKSTNQLFKKKSGEKGKTKTGTFH